jgi:hypothetical protein
MHPAMSCCDRRDPPPRYSESRPAWKSWKSRHGVARDSPTMTARPATGSIRTVVRRTPLRHIAAEAMDAFRRGEARRPRLSGDRGLAGVRSSGQLMTPRFNSRQRWRTVFGLSLKAWPPSVHGGRARAVGCIVFRRTRREPAQRSQPEAAPRHDRGSPRASRAAVRPSAASGDGLISQTAAHRRPSAMLQREAAIADRHGLPQGAPGASSSTTTTAATGRAIAAKAGAAVRTERQRKRHVVP